MARATWPAIPIVRTAIMSMVADSIPAPIVVRSVTAIVDGFVCRVAASFADAASKRQAGQTNGNRSSKSSYLHCRAPSMFRDSICQPNQLKREGRGTSYLSLLHRASTSVVMMSI
jgi:hypothetical protein